MVVRRQLKSSMASPLVLPERALRQRKAFNSMQEMVSAELVTDLPGSYDRSLLQYVDEPRDRGG